MCKILIHLLHADPKHRYKDLDTVKQDLLSLRKNIFQTPLLMRQVLAHPILPEEYLDQIDFSQLFIDFRKTNQANFKNQKEITSDFEVINLFSLKYLAKFMREYDIF
jgi:hypothetical protein